MLATSIRDSNNPNRPPSSWFVTVTTTGPNQAFRINFTVDGYLTTSGISAYVDWDYGGFASASSGNVTNFSYTYPVAGTYTIEINLTYGTATGDRRIVLGNDLTQKSRVTGISAMPRIPNISSFKNTFKDCVNLTSVPNNLFYWPTQGTGLVSTEDLFRSTFEGCTGLTAIPVNLFRKMRQFDGLSGAFRETFKGCTSLTSIHENVFQHYQGLTTNAFQSTFEGCTSLTELSAELFRQNSAATSGAFQGTFKGCTGLTDVPADLFRYATNVVNAGVSAEFLEVFAGVTLPTSVYSDMLVSLDTYLTQSNLAFDAGSSKYLGAPAIAARSSLVSRGWTITDGGLDSP